MSKKDNVRIVRAGGDVTASVSGQGNIIGSNVYVSGTKSRIEYLLNKYDQLTRDIISVREFWNDLLLFLNENSNMLANTERLPNKLLSETPVLLAAKDQAIMKGSIQEATNIESRIKDQFKTLIEMLERINNTGELTQQRPYIPEINPDDIIKEIRIRFFDLYTRWSELRRRITGLGYKENQSLYLEYLQSVRLMLKNEVQSFKHYYQIVMIEIRRLSQSVWASICELDTTLNLLIDQLIDILNDIADGTSILLDDVTNRIEKALRDGVYTSLLSYGIT